VDGARSKTDKRFWMDKIARVMCLGWLNPPQARGVCELPRFDHLQALHRGLVRVRYRGCRNASPKLACDASDGAAKGIPWAFIRNDWRLPGER